MKIYPAILTDSAYVVQQQVDRIKDIDSIDVVQVDVVDGNFADNMTVTAADLTVIDWHDLQIDFHLMVEEPLNYVQEILGLKEHLPVRAVIGQIEQMGDPVAFIKQLRAEKIKSGLSLNIYTPVDTLSHFKIGQQPQSHPDLIQLMGIEAGFQGQEMKQQIFQQLQAVRNWQQQFNLEPEIVVDGGVKIDHVSKLKEFGTNAVAVGSQLWEANNLEQIVTQIVAI